MVFHHLERQSMAGIGTTWSLDISVNKSSCEWVFCQQGGQVHKFPPLNFLNQLGREGDASTITDDYGLPSSTGVKALCSLDNGGSVGMELPCRHNRSFTWIVTHNSVNFHWVSTKIGTEKHFDRRLMCAKCQLNWSTHSCFMEILVQYTKYKDLEKK